MRKVDLKAMGNAISKLVSVVEIIKRRIAGLHQVRPWYLSVRRVTKTCARERGRENQFDDNIRS